MKKSDGGKTRRPKSREVSSRFLNIPSPSPSHETTSSPLHARLKHRSDDSNFITKLWPSTTQKSSQTLAHHLGHDRQNDKHNSLLTRQRSCSTTTQSRQNNFDNKDDAAATKENHSPFFGGSMRYTGKFRFPGRSSISSSPSDSTAKMSEDSTTYRIIPGRLSIDETALRQRSFGARSDVSSSENLDSGSECSDMDSSLGSPFVGKMSPASSYMSATVSSSFRKSGKEVSSKYMSDQQNNRRGSGDASLLTRRVSSLKWGLSPGRYSGESPPVEGGKGGKPPTSPSKGKLPLTSPSRGKGVGGLINLGLDLFKSKKPFPSSSGGAVAVGVAVGVSTTAESVHQLRVLRNRLVQLRYVNGRSEVVNENVAAQTQIKLLHASAALTNLQLSVLQKKLQLEKEKLQMKLYYILRSQIKPLEAWSDVERQHLSAVLRITDSLHSVVCRVPLIEGAVGEPESASFALRYASDLAVSLESMLSTFSPTADKTVKVLAELAEVASQEKSMLEECLELSRFISTLEMEERSLKCTVIQLKSQQQDQRHQQEIAA